MSAGPAAAGRHHTKRGSKTGTSGGSDALRLVLRTQPRSANSSRLATISTDTDRLQVCATGAASTLNTYPVRCRQHTKQIHRCYHAIY